MNECNRDDRCISDNGKEAWFPFLDEQVVLLLQSLPVDQVTNTMCVNSSVFLLVATVTHVCSR